MKHLRGKKKQTNLWLLLKEHKERVIEDRETASCEEEAEKHTLTVT